MTNPTRRTFLTAVGLGALAAPVLASCSSGPGTTPTPTGTGTAAGSLLPDYVPMTAVEADFPGAALGINDVFEHHPRPVTAVTTGTPGDGEPITGLAQLNGAPPQPLASNPYWQELNERIGSEMQIDAVNAGEDFLARVATVQASGDIPDLIQLNPAVPSLAEFLDASMLDLGPYLSGDAVNDYPALANIPQDFWRAGVYNGRLYGIPNPRGMVSSRVMHYRKDILDEQGIEPDVASFADFRDLAIDQTDAAAGRWAIAANPLNYVRQMLGIPNGWSEVDGSYVSAYTHEAQKDALAAVVELQEAGAINPDMGSSAPNQWVEWFGTGVAIFTFGTYTGWGGIYGTYAPGTPGFQIGLLQVPDFDSGSSHVGWSGSLTNNIVCIPKSAEGRAETLLSVVDYLASPFGSEEALFLRYGAEGVTFDWDGDDPAPRADAATQLAIGVGYLGSPPYVFYYPTDPTAGQTVFDHMSEYVKTAVLDPTQIYYSPTFASKNGALSSAIAAVELDIIYGRKSLDDWDDAVETFLAGGGSTIGDELTEAAQAG